MIGTQISDGFIDFANTEFKCPHCEKSYNDVDGKYLDRMNRNKNWLTKIMCNCGVIFALMYDMKGDAVSSMNFKSNNQKTINQ